MKLCKRLYAAVLALLLLLPLSVRAEVAVDPERAVSLTIHGQFEDIPLRTAEFRIYQISGMDIDGSLSPLPAYTQFGELLDIRGENADSWHAAALLLEQHILSERISPTATGTTSESGNVTFSEIPQGLYLVLGIHHKQDGYVYSTNPFFVQLPNWDTETDAWSYAVSAKAKPSRTEELFALQVVKQWRDKGFAHCRPESIELVLYRDGEKYQEITLPQNGRWYCTLENLAANHTWYIEEVSVPGYKSKVVREGDVLIVTNTRIGNTSSSNLPQTGLLWWPVPLLLVSGLGILLMGLICRRKGNE